MYVCVCFHMYKINVFGKGCDKARTLMTSGEGGWVSGGRCSLLVCRLVYILRLELCQCITYPPAPHQNK